MTKSKIEWTDEVWNPVTGCSKVSDGCKNCYAERITARFRKDHLPWTLQNAAHNVVLHPDRVEEPFHWRKPRRVFVNSMSDLFHELVPAEFIYRIFEVMASVQQHTFQILTKRAERMAQVVPRINEYLESKMLSTDNVWLGVSVENQAAADERIPLLLQTPAAVRFLSCEPLLGPVDLGRVTPCGYYCDEKVGHVDHQFWTPGINGGINWVIVGGESGPGARAMNPKWARSLRDQCVEAGVPFFFKQWGEWAPLYEIQDDDKVVAGLQGLLGTTHFDEVSGIGGDTEAYRVGKHAAGRLLDGYEWTEYPEVKHD